MIDILIRRDAAKRRYDSQVRLLALESEIEKLAREKGKIRAADAAVVRAKRIKIAMAIALGEFEDLDSMIPKVE
ncbi:MAG: hypothetical protein [Microvirus sp.]|nr:MAG: hypothetical protein [Microvirus sp.]